jgi:hypothetical protein
MWEGPKMTPAKRCHSLVEPWQSSFGLYSNHQIVGTFHKNYYDFPPTIANKNSIACCQTCG